MHGEKRKRNLARFAQTLHGGLQRAQNHPDAQGHAGCHAPGPAEIQRHHAAAQQRGHADAAQGVQPFLQGGFAPARPHTQHHQKQYRNHQGNKHRVEVGRADREFAHIQRVNDQGVERAQQHGRCGHHQQHAVTQQHRFARDPDHLCAQADRARAPGEQGERTADHQGQKDQNENATGRVGGKGMNRIEHARAHQKSTQQRQGKCADGQQHSPGFEAPPLLSHHQAVDQCRADKPGHQRGVFNRIPEPPTAPAQFGVSPPGTQADAESQEGPCHQRPGARPARPGHIESAGQQRRNGKGKGYGKTHVTHVEHGRMDHQPGVLQQGVEVFALHRDRKEPLKWVGCGEHKQQEAGGDQPQYRDHPRHHGQRHLA